MTCLQVAIVCRNEGWYAVDRCGGTEGNGAECGRVGLVRQRGDAPCFAQSTLVRLRFGCRSLIVVVVALDVATGWPIQVGRSD